MEDREVWNPEKGFWGFFGKAVVFLGIALVLFLVVAFVHDLATGQLPGPKEPCSQYTTYEAQEFCADNLP
jgi:hypothetical protein